jgi:hypothetical protein
MDIRTRSLNQVNIETSHYTRSSASSIYMPTSQLAALLKDSYKWSFLRGSSTKFLYAFVHSSRGCLQLNALLRNGGDEARNNGAVSKHSMGLSVSNCSQDIGHYYDPFTGRTVTLLWPVKPQEAHNAKCQWCVGPTQSLLNNTNHLIGMQIVFVHCK